MEQNNEKEYIGRMTGDLAAAEPAPAEHEQCSPRDDEELAGGLYTVESQDETVSKEPTYAIGATLADASELCCGSENEPIVEPASDDNHGEIAPVSSFSPVVTDDEPVNDAHASAANDSSNAAIAEPENNCAANGGADCQADISAESADTEHDGQHAARESDRTIVDTTVGAEDENSESSNTAHADSEEERLVIDIHDGDERELLCLGATTVGRITIGADGVQRYYPGVGETVDCVANAPAGAKNQHAPVLKAANAVPGQSGYAPVGAVGQRYASAVPTVNGQIGEYAPLAAVQRYDIAQGGASQQPTDSDAVGYSQDGAAELGQRAASDDIHRIAADNSIDETPKADSKETGYIDEGSRDDGELPADSRNSALDTDGDGQERVSPYSFSDDDVRSAYSARLEELDRMSGSWLSDIAASSAKDHGYDETALDGEHSVNGAVAERDHKQQMRTDITALRLRLELEVARLERDCAAVEYSFLHRLDDRREQRIHKKNMKRLKAARTKTHRAVRLEKKDNKRYYSFLHLDPGSKKMSQMADEETVELLRRRLGDLLMKRDEYNQRLIEAYSAQRGKGGKKHSYGRIYEAECRARKKAYKKQKALAKLIERANVDKDDERMLFSLMDERIELCGRRATAIYLLSKERVKGVARREAQDDKAEAERALKKNKKAIARIEKRSISGARDKSRRRRGMIIGWSALLIAAAAGFFIWVFREQIADAVVGTMYWLSDLLGWDFSGLN